MKNTILEYIQSDLINESTKTIAVDEDLLTTGVIDSLSAMKLIAFIEDSFDIKVPPEDMVIENFIDINSIEAYIVSKKS